MSDRYDLVVIGAGSAGLTAARFGSHVGARVLLAEREQVGGDCTWTGCVPSKALLHVARIAHEMRHAGALGLPAVEPHVDLANVMRGVKAVVARVYALESPEKLSAEGIEVVHGHARFLDPHTVEVGGRRVAGERFVVATGAEPAIPPIPGLMQTPHLTYRTVFDLSTLPARLLVLGGGAIGVEMAQAFQRLGARVTLLEALDRIIASLDPEASAALGRHLEMEGVEVRTSANVVQVGRGAAGTISVRAAGHDLEGDALLVAVGRRPRLDGLDLARAEVEHGGNPPRISVDGRLRTSQAHIFAAGDVTGGAQFTHYAGWQGFQAARSALLPGRSPGTRATIPSVVFTDPEVGEVGMSEAEARTRQEPLEVHRWPMERSDRAQTQGATDGFLKLVVKPDGSLLGATAVGGSAGELVNELELIREAGLKLPVVASSIHAYPTYGFAIQQLAAQVTLAKAISGPKGKLLRWLIR